MNDQLLWCSAFFLYVYDSISIKERDAVLRYSIGGVTAVLVPATLTVAGRRLFIPNPLRPDHVDLLLRAISQSELTALEQFFIRRASSMYVVHQIIAIACLLTLFVVTPLLATRMNLLHACLVSVGMIYWLCLFHWIEMWRNRRLIGVDAKVLRSDILHVLLCPPNAVNCARRIATLRRPRYGVLPCLRSFSRYHAEKYEQEMLAERALT